MGKVISAEDIIDRTLASCPEDVRPMIKYLGMSGINVTNMKRRRENAETIVTHLREMGSNDIATFFRGGDGVDYKEVVYDVGVKLKASVKEDVSVVKNEEAILKKLFADALDQMSDTEKRQLFQDMGIKESDIPWGKSGLALVQLTMGQFGGFAVYRISVIVANMIARALLGKGLSFAANAAITRSIGAFLGPIGWIATGAWLLVDLAGPAYRKTVPAVVHMAMLRQLLLNRVTIGVVGDGSAGKDSLVKAVFGIDTGNIDPVAGSTSEAMVYSMGSSGAVSLVNYPGFNDIREDVNKHTEDFIRHTDVFIHVVDITRGISGTEVKILDKLKELDRPILICLNKVDAPRKEDKAKLLKIARERLPNEFYIETAFDPDDRLYKYGPIGCDEVHEWVCEQMRKRGKETSHIPKASREKEGCSVTHLRVRKDN